MLSSLRLELSIETQNEPFAAVEINIQVVITVTNLMRISTTIHVMRHRETSTSPSIFDPYLVKCRRNSTTSTQRKLSQHNQNPIKSLFRNKTIRDTAPGTSLGANRQFTIWIINCNFETHTRSSSYRVSRCQTGASDRLRGTIHVSVMSSRSNFVRLGDSIDVREVSR